MESPGSCLPSRDGVERSGVSGRALASASAGRENGGPIEQGHDFHG